MICFSVALLLALEAKRLDCLSFHQLAEAIRAESGVWIYSSPSKFSIILCILTARCSLSCVCLLSQSCPTLRPGSSLRGDSPGKNTGLGYHALLQGIFPTQGWKPGLPHCRRILYRLSHQVSPYIAVNWRLHEFTKGWTSISSPEAHRPVIHNFSFRRK